MFKKWASTLGLVDPKPPSSVIAQVGKQTLKVEFESEDYEDEDKGVTVGFLRTKIAEATHAPSSNITLVHKGKKLIDNEAYLIDYGVESEAKILVIASTNRPKKVKVKRSATPPVKPKSGKERVEEVVLATKNDLEPMVVEFEKPDSSWSLEKTKEEHHKVSELVLQKMFALDDVDVSEDQELRQARKSAINGMHLLHKRVDAAFEQKKALLFKENQASTSTANEDENEHS